MPGDVHTPVLCAPSHRKFLHVWLENNARNHDSRDDDAPYDGDDEGSDEQEPVQGLGQELEQVLVMDRQR